MRRIDLKLFFGALAFCAGTAFAQDEMDFSLDEVESGGDMTFDVNETGGDMTFDVNDTNSAGSDSVFDPVGPVGAEDFNFDAIDTGEVAKSNQKAKKAERDLVRVIQRRPFLRKKRVELAPFIGTNINDSLTNVFVAGGTLTYHLTEVMGIGINAAYSLGGESDLFHQVLEDYEVYPQISTVLWYANLQFQYAPIYGKFALFNNWILPWDIYALVGAGYAQTELGGHPSLSVGAGTRFMLSKWFTVNLEVRDNIFIEDYPSESVLVNNVLFSGGISFFIPPTFEYKELR